MNSSHLAELEDDIQKQLVRTEGRVREEVSPEEGAAFFFCGLFYTFLCEFFFTAVPQVSLHKWCFCRR